MRPLTSNDVLEIRVPVVSHTPILFHFASLFLLILIVTVCTVECHQTPTGAQEPHDDRVALYVGWGLTGRVDESRRESTTIGDGQLQTDSCRSLVVGSRVVGEPDEHGWDCRFKDMVSW